MKNGVARYDFRAKRRERTALQSCHRAASFFDKQPACSSIPRAQAYLVKSIQPATRKVRQVKGGGPSPAKISDLGQDLLEIGENSWQMVSNIIRETGCYQCCDGLVGTADSYRMAVEPSALTLNGIKQFVHHGSVNGSNERPSFTHQGNRGGEVRKPMGKVGGAIKRIHDPA